MRLILIDCWSSWVLRQVCCNLQCMVQLLLLQADHSLSIQILQSLLLSSRPIQLDSIKIVKQQQPTTDTHFSPGEMSRSFVAVSHHVNSILGLAPSLVSKKKKKRVDFFFFFENLASLTAPPSIHPFPPVCTRCVVCNKTVAIPKTACGR